jgi:predicted nucleic acid-binding protein
VRCLHYARVCPLGYSYRELCAIVSKRRVDLMIAAIAIGDGAALATRNVSDFDELQPLLTVIAL